MTLATLFQSCFNSNNWSAWQELDAFRNFYAKVFQPEKGGLTIRLGDVLPQVKEFTYLGILFKGEGVGDWQVIWGSICSDANDT